MRPTAESTVGFYDAWARRLIGDYIRGNPRAESAITFAVEWCPDDAANILDIGCGIGWSTYELARHHPRAAVLGLDLSPRLVEVARELFGDERRAGFETSDFVDSDAPLGSFDAVVLLDVYEHFPQSSRLHVHERLRSLLSESARLILTTPTVGHQNFLRQHHPDRLQPVDEDVTENGLDQLAADIGGRVIERASVSVWRPDDYLHTAIERGTARSTRSRPPAVEPPAVRSERLRERLGLRWTPAAGVLAARGRDRICVAKTWTMSETFIRAHLENLPASVFALGATAYRSDDGGSLLPLATTRPLRMLARVLRRSVSGAEDRAFEALPHRTRSRMYERYFRRERIDLVLAEYGPTAAELEPACTAAGLPLVTHFHGYDAFRTEVIEQYRSAYQRIFARGWPVVAVSESMKRQLVELGATAEQVHVIRYGIDLEDFSPTEPTPGLVVMVGRLVDKKAPQLAVRAFAQAAERVPEARLVIIGDGPLRPVVERTISELRLEGRVQLDGARDHDWVAKAIQQAAVFMQHSVVADDGDREGTPVAILEAGAAGVPVVATRHEGIAEVVANGETGLLVDEGDVDAMGDALADLLLNPDQARALGAAGRARVETIASREASIRQLWAVLETALADARRRRQ